MKMKTSVTLPDELLERIDRVESNRSAFIERAAVRYLAELEKTAREAEDLRLINRHADRLNKEAEDVLDYQGSV